MPLVGTAHDRLCAMERPYLRLCPPYKLAQLEAAASLEIAQVAGEILANPDIGATSKPYLEWPKIITPKRLLAGTKQDAERKTDMRFVSVAFALAIVTGSAFAQEMRDGGSMKGEGKGRHAAQSSEQQKIDQDKKKAAEDAYKAALKGIPDSKTTVDPWRGVR
jgi:hypothetical protein